MSKRLPFQIVLLVGAAVVAALIANATRSRPLRLEGDPELLRYPGVKAISPQEAARVQREVSTLFLDVRSKPAYEAAHVHGAIRLASDSLEVAYAELRDFLGPEMRLIVYGQEAQPAVRAVKYLAERGNRAEVLQGGWMAWKAQGLPVEGTEVR